MQKVFKNILALWPNTMQGGGLTVFRERLRLLKHLGCDVHVLTTEPLDSRLTDFITFEWVSHEDIKLQMIRYLDGELRKLIDEQDGEKSKMRIGKARDRLNKLGELFLAKNRDEHDQSIDYLQSLGQSSFARYFNRSFPDPLVQLLTFLSPDVLFASFAWNAPLFDYCSKTTVRILDIHDVQSTRTEVAKAAGGDLEDRGCSAAEEAEMLGKADILLALEHKQVGELRKLSANTQIIHCPYSPAAVESLGSPQMSRQLLFVGNLYDPNVRGLAAFLKDDWPALRDEGCELIVIGKIGEAFEPTDGITLAGYLKDLQPFYARSSIVLNLALYCTGLPIKTVEGLSFGKCVVSTPGAAEPLPEYPNIPVVQARLGSMVAPILSLIRSTDQRRIVEHDSFTYARRWFSGEAASAGLARALTSSGAKEGSKGAKGTDC